VGTAVDSSVALIWNQEQQQLSILPTQNSPVKRCYIFVPTVTRNLNCKCVILNVKRRCRVADAKKRTPAMVVHEAQKLESLALTEATDFLAEKGLLDEFVEKSINLKKIDELDTEYVVLIAERDTVRKAKLKEKASQKKLVPKKGKE